MSNLVPDLLRVAGLTKRFVGQRGIVNVSLSVPAGSITGFIGANGAGKSTTLRCILGLLRPDAGEIRVFGTVPTPSLRSRIGFLPEERGLFGHEGARDAIVFHGRLKGMSRKDARASADELLERFGLGLRKNERIGLLSKGNAQRVQVLCALVHRPQLLLLDEPLSGLDPIAQAELMSLVAEFRVSGGAVLFSTHSMAAAESICDRIVILADGRSVFEGSLNNAAALAPHGAIVVTADAAGLVSAASMIGGRAVPLGSAMAGATRWRVLLPPSVTHPVLLRSLSEHAVPLMSFQPIKADLESAFWQLVEQTSLEKPMTATLSRSKAA
jgi:ABC-2 type transport system ATP-binding protein